MGLDELPAPSLGIFLYHEEGSEQGHSKLDTKEVTKDNDGIENVKGIQCQLSRDNFKKVENIYKKKMKREPKAGTEELIHGHSVGWTGGHSIP